MRKKVLLEDNRRRLHVSVPLRYLMTREVEGELVLGWARAQPAGLNMRGNSTRGLRPYRNEYRTQASTPGSWIIRIKGGYVLQPLNNIISDLSERKKKKKQTDSEILTTAGTVSPNKSTPFR